MRPKCTIYRESVLTSASKSSIFQLEYKFNCTKDRQLKLQNLTNTRICWKTEERHLVSGFLGCGLTCLNTWILRHVHTESYSWAVVDVSCKLAGSGRTDRVFEWQLSLWLISELTRNSSSSWCFPPISLLFPLYIYRSIKPRDIFRSSWNILNSHRHVFTSFHV